MIREDRDGRRLVLRFDGAFDAAEGWKLHEALAALDAADRVTLDFAQVRQFHDFAIALLAQDISSLDGRVEARGLSHHQRRILRYFGVAAEALDGERERPRAAEAKAASAGRAP